MIKAFKTKIYPTKNQRIYFHKCFGIRRFAWNWGVENWNTYKSNYKLDTAWNNSSLKTEKPYLFEVNSMIKTRAFKDLKEAWNKVKRGEAEEPNFKSKKKDSNRFSMFEKTPKTRKTRTIMFKNKTINLNGTRKIGRLNIKCAENLEFLNDENIRVCEWTISENNNNYFISIVYERANQEHIEVEKPLNKIGIDVGVKTVITSYNGTEFNEINLPYKIRKLEKYKNYLNKKLSRKTYNSNRYRVLKSRINKVYEKISNIKNDLYNKIVFNLATNYKTINYESFTFKASKEKKINESLYRTAPSLLKEKLIYKCKEYNTTLNLIENEPTTQTCSCCGHRYIKKEKLTLLDRVYKCCECGLEIGRDRNSAINIYNLV